MSHGDSITRLPDGFRSTAQTGLVAVRRPRRPATRNLYGIQFHPEVVHTPHGRDVLRNFVLGIAGAAPTWTPANFIDATVAEIRARVDAHAARDRLGRAGHLRPVAAASTRPSPRRSSTAPSATG